MCRRSVAAMKWAMEASPSQPGPEELLAWYIDLGVDVALEETPVNRFVAPQPRPQAENAPPSFDEEDSEEERPRRANAPALPRTIIQPAPQALATSDEVARAATEAAQAATTLDELRTALENFDGCNLAKTATQLVFCDGTPGSRVMLVGEAPGRDEDIQGKPFVGRSGQLLDRMLAAIGLDRSSVYIANVVPWRPPGNRTPTPQETAACRPFITRQIELAKPDFLICLGAPSAAELLGNKVGILKFRGQWKTYQAGEREIRAMATLHPAYLLRQPMQKRLAWRDLLSLRAALDGKDQA